MRFHPLAISAVVGALASSTSSTVDAFVVPKSASQTAQHHPTTAGVAARSTSTSAWMAAKNDGSEYMSLEESLFDKVKNFNSKDIINNEISNSNDFIDAEIISSSNENSNSNNNKPKTRKPNVRTEKLRAQLEADLTAAEESRTRTAQQLADAESSKLNLETEATNAAKEAEALATKFKAFEAKEAAKAAGAFGAGGAGVGGIVVEIAGPLLGGFAAFGGLAAARNSLAARSEKVEEERLQKEEEERKAEEAAKKKASQQAQSKNLPLIGAGVAGLGAFGAFLGSGGDIGGETAVDAMSKNALRDALSKQETKISQQNTGSVKTAVPDASTAVEMPYLEKEIARAETKQQQKQQKERAARSKSKRQLAREAAEEQKAAEARLEQKLAEAPELARKAAEAEAKAATEAQAAEEARIEAERNALLEKQAAERNAAVKEKKALEVKQADAAAAVEKQRIAAKLAEEKAIAEKVAAEKRTVEEQARVEEKAKAEKMAADKLAFEKMKAEERAKADKLAAEQRAKEQRAAEEKEKAEQKAKAEMAAAREREDAAALVLLKEQEAKSKGFFPKVPAVSEMLFGNKKPSQVTDKGLSNIFSGNKIVVGGVALAGAAVAAAVIAANESPAVKSTFKVTGKTPKDYLESKDKGANGPPAAKKTVPIPQPEAPQTSSLAGSKEALRDELAKQRANINRQSAEKSSPAPTAGNTPTPSSDASNLENMGGAGPAFVPPPAKKSFSPFGGGKPKAAVNDSLYSPAASQGSMSDASSNAPVVQPMPPTPETPIPEQNTFGGGSSTAVPKKSFSPFGGAKPVAPTNDSLYSAPSSQSVPETSSDGSYTNDMGEGPPASTTGNGFSPFGGSKPVAAASDSLYSAPSSPSEPSFTSPEPSTFTPNESPPAPKSYSPFGGAKPMAATNDSLYSSPTSQSSSDGGNSYSIPETEPAFASPEPASFGSEVSASPPKSFSPFGGAKPVAANNDSLYSAPTGGPFDMVPNDTEENLPFAASGLDDTSAATGIPETTAFRAPPMKKSFSPFGSKPVAPSDTNNSGGGYLDGL